jgi:N-formylglutamate deformylase
MADSTYLFEPGPLPLLVSMPHVGTQIPPELAARMTPAALQVPDTDWHLPQLYDFLKELGANLLVAVNSRYVIDLNRDPAGTILYPGASNTELCPLRTFQSAPIYKPGREPDAAEIGHRIGKYWRPYHLRLAEELAALKARHGYALLFDAHSIKSELPRFFEGRLWDINLGTADGKSAAAPVGSALLAAAEAAGGYTTVLNGRFKGGYITRTYGAPAAGIHAAQLELSWRTYMDEGGSFAFDEVQARAVRPVLRSVVEALLAAGTVAGGPARA